MLLTDYCFLVALSLDVNELLAQRNKLLVVRLMLQLQRLNLIGSNISNFLQS
jgi:hypothetical protein